MIKFNFDNSSIQERVFQEYSQEIAKIHKRIHENANNQDEFLGWVELPTNYDKQEFQRIQESASKIQKNSDFIIYNLLRKEKHHKSCMWEIILVLFM